MITVKPLRFTGLFCLVFVFYLASVQCFGPGGADTGSAMGVMGCGGGSEMGMTIGDTGTESATDAGFDGPVDIPVTIAKNNEGVDATSVYMQPSGNPYLKKHTSRLQAESDTTVGTVYFTLQNNVCRYVGVVRNNEFSEFLTPDSQTNCQYHIDLTTADVEIPLALVALAENDTPDSITSASYPVVPVLRAPEGYVEEYSLNVFITALSEDSTTASADATEIPAIDVNPFEMAFMDLGGTSSVVFSAVNGSNNEFWQLAGQGGVSELFTSTDVLPQDMSVSFADNLAYFFDDQSSFYQMTSAGTINEIALSSLGSDGAPDFDAHEGGGYVAYVCEGVNPTTNNNSMAPCFYDVENETVMGPVFQVDQDYDVVALTVKWAQGYVLFTAGQTSAGDYFLGGGDAADVLAGAAESFISMAIFQDAFISDPQPNPGAKGFFVRCMGSSGAISLCYYDSANYEMEVLVDAGIDIQPTYRASKNTQYMAFSIATDPPTLGIGDLTDGTVVFPTFGEIPATSNTDDDIVAYQHTLNDTQQVAILNLNYNAEISHDALEMLYPSLGVVRGDVVTLPVSGGLPPFSYTITSGIGSINEYTGTYTAPSDQTGTAVATVTDAEGTTDVSSISVQEAETWNLAYDSDGVKELASNTEINAMEFADDGWFYLAGNTSDGKFWLAKTGGTGILSDTFGTNGIVTTANPSGKTLHANAVTTIGVGDNKVIFVGGYVVNDSGKDFVIAKYSSSGVLDTSFGVNGFVEVDFGNNGDDIVTALAMDGAGYFFAAGSSFNGNDTDLAVVKLSAAGAFVPTFGTAGKKRIDINTGSEDTLSDVLSMSVDNQTHVVLAGSTTKAGASSFVLARLEKNGNLSPAFGTAGITTYQNEGRNSFLTAIMLTNDRIDAFGYVTNPATAKNDGFFKSFTTSGQVVNMNATDAQRRLSVTGASVVLTSVSQNTLNQQYYVGGYLEQNGRKIWLVGRYDFAGYVDMSFSDDGILTFDDGSVDQRLVGIKYNLSNDLYVAGTLSNETVPAIGLILL